MPVAGHGQQHTKRLAPQNGVDAMPDTIEYAPELIGAVVGVVLSLAASYVPRFREAWAQLAPDTKRGYMAVMIAAFGVLIYVLACSGSGFWVACPAGGAWRLLSIIVSALIANQAIYPITPQTTDVKTVKEVRKQFDKYVGQG